MSFELIIFYWKKVVSSLIGLVKDIKGCSLKFIIDLYVKSW